MVDAFAQLGVPLHLSLSLGLIELAFTALFAIPRTSVLGGLLLTAYFGGATATQVRVEAGWFPTIFPSPHRSDDLGRVSRSATLAFARFCSTIHHRVRDNEIHDDGQVGRGAARLRRKR